MKKPFVVLAASLAFFTINACKTAHKTTMPEKELVTVMTASPSVKSGAPVLLTFTVQNPTTEPLKFLKWETPFEGFRNSFLDIRNGSGATVQYRGIMAKRMMPPPADAYVTVAPGHPETASIDITKAYDVTKPGTYTVEYTASGMSGLKKINKTSFTVTE